MLLLSNSTNLEQIGLEYPQIQKMSNGYPNYSLTSVQTIDINNRLEYTPNLNSFVVEKKSKLTDLLSFHIHYSLLISKKLLTIFLESNIENFQYFEADIIHKNKHYCYYYFFIYGQDYNLVDYKNMTFHDKSDPIYNHSLNSYDMEQIKTKEIKVESGEQIINWQKLYPEYPNFEYSNLKLNYDNINRDLIRLPFLLGGHYFVSEKLCDKIIEAKCTGIDFRTKDWKEREIL